MRSNILDLLTDAEKAQMYDDVASTGKAVMQITVDKKSRVAAVRVPPGREYDNSIKAKVLKLFKGGSDEKGEV